MKNKMGMLVFCVCMASMAAAMPDERALELANLRRMDPEGLRLAFDDLAKTSPARFDAAAARAALAAFVPIRKRLDAPGLTRADEDALLRAAAPVAAKLRAALLQNPLLDDLKLLVVKRALSAEAENRDDAGFIEANYFSHHRISHRTGWTNEIAVLENLRGTPKLTTLYVPPATRIVRDLNLDYDAKHLLFSSVDANRQWAVYEIPAAGGTAAQLSPTNFPDLDFFQPCYLPDGRVILGSTSSCNAVPCLSGESRTSSLCLFDRSTGRLRQLTYDQDHASDPTVLPDGRIYYHRWEYTDIPHYFSRRRFTMNPDGTGQLALHGSAGWFPNGFRGAKPVPGHHTLLVGVLSGHHDYSECGRLCLLDPALAEYYPFRYRHPPTKEWGIEGTHLVLIPEILPKEQTGVVQLIPGRGKTVPNIICDDIVRGYFLKERPELMANPCPLSEHYFLVAMKPQTGNSWWGIWLVDVFDNMTKLAEIPGYGLFEPTPFRAVKRPPVIVDRVDLKKTTATVHVGDVYTGVGLRGVPRGTVKALRVYTYNYFFYDAHHYTSFDMLGMESAWDGRIILGTAKVEADGSAEFIVPANQPIVVQPLDAEGRAVQVMRSWFTGMPGERVSCAGCHERRNEAIQPRQTLATKRGPEPLVPWYGKPRPFEFAFEVYPVLQRRCIGCHSGPFEYGGPHSKPSFADPQKAYDTLRPYIHVPGVESGMAVHEPMEYHASTSPLFRMLEKGHHGLLLTDLTAEERDRLITWLDLNGVNHSTYRLPDKLRHFELRRYELRPYFSGLPLENPEAQYREMLAAFAARPAPAFIPPPRQEAPAPAAPVKMEYHPVRESRTIDLGGGVIIKLRLVSAGNGVKKPFWIAETEITNGQYEKYDPDHDTGYHDIIFQNHVQPGWIANHVLQPVSRVTWEEANGFCRWLSKQSGLTCSLPTGAQWERAARGFHAEPFYFGPADTAAFGSYANLADEALRKTRTNVWPGPGCIQVRYDWPRGNNFPLRDERANDGCFCVNYVAQYLPNAFGLFDMIGNVSEWTLDAAGPAPDTRKIARGGSWADRPCDAAVTARFPYEPWQKVYDVGFRIVAEK